MNKMSEEPQPTAQIPNPEQGKPQGGFAEILREQAEVNVLLPAGSRRYRDWRDVPTSLQSPRDSVSLNRGDRNE